MPTLGTHVSDELAETIKRAAIRSDQKKVGPWLERAAMERLTRDGFIAESPQAKVIAFASELGASEAAEILSRAVRRKKGKAA